LEFIPPVNLFRFFMGSTRPKEYTTPLTRDQALALPEVEFDPLVHGRMNTALDSASSPSSSFSVNQRQVEADAKSPPQPPPNDSHTTMNIRCSICLEDFKAREKVRMLPCSHLYHSICIFPWLTACKGVCPLCQQHVLYRNLNESRQNVVETPGQSDTVPADCNDITGTIMIDVDDDEVTEVSDEDEHLQDINDEGGMSEEHNFTQENSEKR